MTVVQYLATFSRLARYFPKLVSTEVKKALKFKRGLRQDIGGRIASDRFETMEAVVLAAKGCINLMEKVIHEANPKCPNI